MGRNGVYIDTSIEVRRSQAKRIMKIFVLTIEEIRNHMKKQLNQQSSQGSQGLAHLGLSKSTTKNLRYNIL
jgi:F0F1-type ATP synthase membrane subunit b/b'